MGKDQTPKRSGIDFKAAQKLLDQKKKEKINSGGLGDTRWMRLPEVGDLKVRFLPPIEGEPVPGYVVHKHYNLPNHEGLKGNITCFRTWGMQCPICDVLEEYQDRVDLHDYFGTSSYFNVLVLDHKDCDPKLPYLLQASEYSYEWLLQQLVNIDVGDITDVEDGADVTFRRKKKKGAFDRIISRKSRAISDDPAEIDEILDAMYDMKKIWKEGDDNYYNIAVDLANQLRDIIEDRLLKLGDKAGDKDKPVREVADAKRGRGKDKEEDYHDTGKKQKPDEDKQPETTGRRRRSVSDDQPDGDKQPEQPETTGRRRRSVADEPEEDKGKGKGKPEKDEEKQSTGSGKKASNKHAKECFGKEHSDDRECQICPFEYDCENASA